MPSQKASIQPFKSDSNALAATSTVLGEPGFASLGIDRRVAGALVTKSQSEIAEIA